MNTSSTTDPPPRGKRKGRLWAPDHEPLALWLRAVLFVAGWLLVLLGVAGIFLPVLQAWIILPLGAAVLSLVSDWALHLLRWTLKRWPKLWGKVLRRRRRLRSRLLKLGGSSLPAGGGDENADDHGAPGAGAEPKLDRAAPPYRSSTGT